MNLYQLSAQYQDFLQVLDDPELTPEAVQDTLQALSGELQDKCLNVARYAENCKAESKAIDEAMKRMNKRKNAIDNRADSMKKYLLQNMIASGITEIKSPEFVLKVGKGRESVEIVDASLVPSKFKTIKTVKSISKTDIKNNGGCAGARIVRNPTLSIK